MNASKPTIYSLPEYGLSVAQLTALGATKVKLRVHLRHIDEKSLFRFRPAERTKKMKKHYESFFSRVKKNWNDGPLDISWIRKQPRAFTASVEARGVSRLLQMPEIAGIWIIEITGRKRVMPKPKQCWFSVKARFAIQIEGRTKGMQSYEDRTVVVKALTFEDAKNRLQPEFKQYATPYLNPRGLMVKWAFERFLDCYEIGDEEIDPQGTEVFSELNKRRMKPVFEWKTKQKLPATSE
jgi:hypothetical protein